MKITVIIPLYNKASYVVRAIRSVLAQTYENFELLVIDDGSTDGSAEIVRSIVDPRIRLIHQPNAGVSAARNTGIDLASTEWIGFLDADDLWEKEFLEETVAVVGKHPEVVAVFTNYFRARTGRPARETSEKSGIVSNYFSFCAKDPGAGMWSSATICNREAIQQAGVFPVGIKYGEDVDTWVRLAWLGKPLYYVEKVLAKYTNDDQVSAMNTIPATTFPYCVKTFREWNSNGRIPAQLVDSTNDYLNWFMLNYCYHLIEAGRGTEAVWTILGQCRFSGSQKKNYIKYLLRAFVPSVLRSKWDQSRRSAQSQNAAVGTKA